MSGVKKRKAESGDRNLFNPSQAPRKSSSNISILRQLMEKKIANQGTDWQREPAKLVPLHQLAWQPEKATVHVCKECKKDQKRDVVFECGHVLVCVEWPKIWARWLARSVCCPNVQNASSLLPVA